MCRISRNRTAFPDDVLCFFIFDKYENGYGNFGYFRDFRYCYKICLFADWQGNLNGQSMGHGIETVQLPWELAICFTSLSPRLCSALVLPSRLLKVSLILGRIDSNVSFHTIFFMLKWNHTFMEGEYSYGHLSESMPFS